MANAIELSFRLLFGLGKLVSCRKLSILRNTIWWNDNGKNFWWWWIPQGNDFFLFLVTICDTRALAARLINHQITWWFFMSLPGGERPWERGWIMAGLWAELNLEKLVVFPLGYCLKLGGGFPIASYPFSGVRFSESTLAKFDDEGHKVTAFLFLVTIRATPERRHLLFVRESDFIGFLCNSWFSLIQIIIS